MNSIADIQMTEASVRLVLDETRTVLFASGDMPGLLGFSSEDFSSGKISLLERLHPDDLDVIDALFSPDPAASPETFNFRLRHADKQIRCIVGLCARTPTRSGPGFSIELVLQDARFAASPDDALPMTPHFRAVIENADDYIFFKDRNHVFTGISQSLAALIGYAGHYSELIGKTDYEIFPEVYADVYYRLEKHVYSGIPVSQEIQAYLAPDGSKGWVDNRKYPIKNDQGEIIGLFGVARDVTQRVLADQALKQERETLQMILDHAPIGIWLQNGHGKLGFVNQAFCQATGISEADFLAVPHYGELIPPEFRQQCLDSDAKALAAPGVSITDQRLPFVDGRIHDLRVIKAVKRDAEKNPVALIGLSLDMTEEREQEMALRESEERFRRIFEQVPAISVQGYDRERRVIFWNKASESLYGISREDALGQRLEDLIVPPAIRHIVRRDIEAWINDGVPIPSGELTLQRFDGQAVEVFSSHVMLQNAKAEPEMYCVDINITERKRVAAELESHRQHLEEEIVERTSEVVRAKEAAETANVAKSAFLANMSHEIRTPLNAITGMAHLIRKAGLTPDQSVRLDTLESSTRHLLGIINAILDLSKIEAGKFVLEEQQIDLHSIFGNVLSMLHDRDSAKNLKVLADMPAIACHLLGDCTRLQQALLNFATNAVKFTEAGSVTLRATVREDSADSMLLVFEVEDTGPGIEPATLARLFAPFEQADNSTTRKYGGTGLGLVITKKVAQLMGGDAGASSTPGVGSLFWFTARLRKGKATRPALFDAPSRDAEALLKAGFSGQRILLVEDEPINQEITQALLADAGLQVDAADDGFGAIEKLAGQSYALILMDMQMPNMDGLEATRRIRQMPGGATMPIVAMTANAFMEDRMRCIEAGMNDHIAKPLDPLVFYETILKWLENSSSAEG